MGKPDARLQLGRADAGPLGADQAGNAAHVVIAKERRHGQRRRLAALIEHVALEQVGQHISAPALPQHRADRGLKREIKHGGIAIAAGELCDIAIARLLPRDFAEDREVRDTARLCRFQQRRNERLPKTGIDMARRVDAVAVDAEVLDPLPVDSNHAFAHAGMFGEQIIQPDEITKAAALAGERAVAAVVIELRIV